MTKKDYIAIAVAIRDALNEPIVAGRETCGINLVARNIADVLALRNPLFNRNMFLEACGVSDF